MIVFWFVFIVVFAYQLVVHECINTSSSNIHSTVKCFVWVGFVEFANLSMTDWNCIVAAHKIRCEIWENHLFGLFLSDKVAICSEKKSFRSKKRIKFFAFYVHRIAEEQRHEWVHAQRQPATQSKELKINKS